MSQNVSPPPQVPVLPPEVYGVFCGSIDQQAVQRIFNGFATAMAHKVPHLHILFQSTGGFVGDGVCLYNFFRSLPIDLTLYNVGSVQSIATIAFLGAKKRKASARATFMIHRSYKSPQFTNAHGLKSIADDIALDDKRTESILRDHIRLPDEKWNDLNALDLVFSGEDAVRIGIADEIGEFSPPPGEQIFNI